MDDENFLKYGDIEFEVSGDVVISATFSGEDLSGADERISDGGAVKVYAVEGGINIEGAEGMVSIYSAGGVLIQTAGTGYVSLQPGLYIVNAAGESHKVIVK